MKWALGHTRELLHEPAQDGALAEYPEGGSATVSTSYPSMDSVTQSRTASLVASSTPRATAARCDARSASALLSTGTRSGLSHRVDGCTSAVEVRQRTRAATFLLERARDGFSFPLNPVAVRDQGWLVVLEALQQEAASRWPTSGTGTPVSGVLNRIARCMQRCLMASVVNEVTIRTRVSPLSTATHATSALALLEVRGLNALIAFMKQALREGLSEATIHYTVAHKNTRVPARARRLMLSCLCIVGWGPQQSERGGFFVLQMSWDTRYSVILLFL